ncbi:MAG: hypothetical protein ABT940_03080 [Alphaproteobacteria bacterium]
MNLKEELIDKASRYCQDRGISMSRLANLVVNEGKFFKRITNGGEFTVATYEKFQTYFREHQIQPISTEEDRL